MKETPGIHTFQTDLADAVSDESISKIDILLEKNKKNETSGLAEERKNILPVIIVILGSVVISLILIFIYIQYRSNKAPTVQAPVIAPQELIYFDSLKEVSPSTYEYKAKPDAIGVTFYQTDASAGNFLSILSPSIPPSFLRSISDKWFFGGVPAGNFIILKTDSFQRAYPGMLEWEPSMKKDLLGLFDSSSTVSVGNFNDQEIGNLAVRVLHDQQGNTLFMYGFTDNNTILMAKNNDTFNAISGLLLK